MSPHLDRTMFTRGDNLSGRRPLLAERPWVVQTAAYSEPRRPPPPPAPRRCLDRAPPQHNSFGKPSAEYPLDGFQRGREKVTYYTRPEHSPERRGAELVFRFDTPSSDARGLRVPAEAVARFGAGVAQPRLVPPDKDGPFVFGVHSPSQFRLPTRLAEDEEHVAAQDSRAGGGGGRDNASDWSARGKHKSFRVLNRMFQIKDNRCKKRVSGKKDKIKCVLVGDGAVGKSSLIAAYAQNEFRNEYEPTAHDTFNVVVEVDDRPICVEICDTAGQDSMSELRALSYPGADVLLLCFSLVRPETFRSVRARWLRAVAGVRAPLVLVGTQADLTADKRVLDRLRMRGESVVSESEARALAASINAEYVETSAKTRSKLKDAFDTAILAGLPVKKKSVWSRLLCLK